MANNEQVIDLIATIAAHQQTCPYAERHPSSCLKAIRSQAAIALRLLGCDEDEVMSAKANEILLARKRKGTTK